jgi:putative hydrolase of the HAD superfamily
MKIEAVIFDFGGVLFEIDYNAPVRAFEALGMESFAAAYSQAQQEEIFDLLETGKIPGEAFYEWISSYLPKATRAELENAWNSILLYLLPERVDYIFKLKEKGIRTFLFSNTNMLHVEVFERMVDKSYGLEKFKSAFEFVHYSNELGMRKPHPESFLEICRIHGLTPEKTIFVDDSIQHVEGSIRAGLIGLHLLPHQTPAELIDPLF